MGTEEPTRKKKKKKKKTHPAPTRASVGEDRFESTDGPARTGEESSAQAKRRSSRVKSWLEQLARTPGDQALAKATLNRIRDDPNATGEDREQFYLALAQQSFVWYLEALRGQPYSAEEIRFLVTQEARKASEAGRDQ